MKEVLTQTEILPMDLLRQEMGKQNVSGIGETSAMWGMRGDGHDSSEPKERVIRRYTSIPGVIDTLRRRQLPLLDPQYWDDRNDSYFMRLYKEYRGANRCSFRSICGYYFDEAWPRHSGHDKRNPKTSMGEHARRYLNR